MRVTNDELLTTRELRRDFARYLDQLDGGKLEKLVLMRGTDMEYVVLPVKTYEQLTREETDGSKQECADNGEGGNPRGGNATDSTAAEAERLTRGKRQG